MKMTIFHALAYLFFIGSTLGWCIEVIYRRFAPDNKERKWVNPGFCAGPYLPIYGIALCVLFSFAYAGRLLGIDKDIQGTLLLFVIMAIGITIIEYIAGVISIKCFNVKLWDYSKEFLNFQGIICLKFTFFWWLLSAVYYFLIDDNVWEGLMWLNDNLAFLFVVGYFFGIFTIDLVMSANVLTKLKQFAKDNDVVVKYEKAQEKILSAVNEVSKKKHFFVRDVSNRLFKEIIKQYGRELKEVDIRNRKA